MDCAVFVVSARCTLAMVVFSFIVLEVLNVKVLDRYIEYACYYSLIPISITCSFVLKIVCIF